MVRGPYYDKNGLKRGAWSKDEDEKLRAYIERYGHLNWRQLPKLAGLSRCGKSCRLRWVNYLRPNLKRGNYTHEEEQIIIKLHEQHGNKWSLIAGKLPGRTDNEVKNYWHSHLKKRLQCNHEMTPEFKTKPSDTSEGETTQSTESEKPILGGIESSPPMYTGECDPNIAAPWEIFEEFSNFWTQPFISENTYSQQNYYLSPSHATNGVDMDHYLSYFFDNKEFLCQVMQESPN